MKNFDSRTITFYICTYLLETISRIGIFIFFFLYALFFLILFHTSLPCVDASTRTVVFCSCWLVFVHMFEYVSLYAYVVRVFRIVLKSPPRSAAPQRLLYVHEAQGERGN